MKKRLNIFLPIMLLLFYSCGSDDGNTEKFIRPVKYQELQLGGSSKILTFSGTALTDKVINLSFRNNGIITEHYLKIGKRVSKGELLAKLDNVQSRLSYENAVSSLNSAESQMNTAKLSYDRIRLLYEKGSASLSDFEAAKNSYRTAQESYESSKRGVEIQEEQIRYGFLNAPDDGVISAVHAEIEENVSPGQTIAVLNAGTDMEVSLGIPESVINLVQIGMEVCIRLTSLPDQKFKGKVTEVSPAIDANTSTYPLRVVFLDPNEDIKSGMAANVEFKLKAKANNEAQIIVPAHAVGEDSKGRFVFIVVKQNNKNLVKKQHIHLGELTTEGFIVEKGLKAKQKIVTAGLQTLLDGQEVKLQ